MINPIMQYFQFQHLKDGNLREVSEEIQLVAVWMNERLPDGPEKSAGLRKLLEAKDCFVRAVL